MYHRIYSFSIDEKNTTNIWRKKMIDGRKIKKRRKELGFSQKDLAKDICTQGIISKIERNELNPSEELLSKITERLNIDNDELRISEVVFNRQEEINTLKDMAIEFHRKKEYHSIPTLISQNKELVSESIKHSNYYEIFFKWLKAELMYHLKGKPKEAIKILSDLRIEDEDIDEELKAHVMISLGVMHYVIRENDLSIELYRKAEEYINESLHFKTQVRFFYDFSLVLTRKKLYNKALLNCTEAIDLLVKNESIYLLGYLYYEIGYVYSDLKKADEALEAYNIALSIFKIENTVKMIVMTKLEIEAIYNNTSNDTKMKKTVNEDLA